MLKKLKKRQYPYPAIFQNIEKDEGLTHEFSDEDEKDEIINKQIVILLVKKLILK